MGMEALCLVDFLNNKYQLLSCHPCMSHLSFDQEVQYCCVACLLKFVHTAFSGWEGYMFFNTKLWNWKGSRK